MGIKPDKTALQPQKKPKLLPPRKPATPRPPASAAPPRVPSPPQTPTKAQGNSWLSLLGALALLCGAAGLTVGGAWIAILLIVDPDAIVGLNQYLPTWTRIPVANQETYQTLSEIRASIRQAGRIPGEPISLGNEAKGANKSATATDLLIPVLARRPLCQATSTLDSTKSNCEQIVELQVYRPVEDARRQIKQEQSYWLASQIAVAGPEESFAIAPLVDANSENQGSARSLPLTTIQRFEGKVPTSGVWLLLSGELVRGDDTIAYGRVAHYNPDRDYLGWMLEWTSSTGQAPAWKAITSGATPELVVDQTVGLEPQFEVYQVQPRQFLPDPIQLEAISLSDPAFDTETYGKIMTLARSGLWSPALAWFKSLRQASEANPDLWSNAAQAEMDFVRLHAEATQAQAEKSWASPSQQVLTNLIDGRWARALSVFQASVDNSQEVASLLKGDADRLWNRVEAALKVDPMQTDAKAWGALIVGAKKDKAAAIAWLKKQPQTKPAAIAQISKLLDRLDPNFSDVVPPSTHLSQVVGTAEPIKQINPADWWQLKNSSLKLEAGQTWYEVEVTAFYDGKRWQRSNFSDLKFSKADGAEPLWNLLGLTTDPQLQILVWTDAGQQDTVFATAKAIQLQGGTIRILAAGDPLPAPTAAQPLPRPLALTTTALQWTTPAVTTLADLNQQQPKLANPILQALATELQQSNQLPAGVTATPAGLLQQSEIGSWQVQQIDLTGNQQIEAVFTLDPETLATLQLDQPDAQKRPAGRSRTLIVSDTGAVLYNEFNGTAQQSLLAIADLGDGGISVLVVDGSTGYRLQRWSSKKQQFE
ncbi:MULTISPECIES: hypothetical protein [Trichocoleus]|uniref:Uncharacterized protein n=1 Tax=Trichocoleus desertorum GB2-A4 TaxID=2933944 RepID=A0ABV0JFS3_9CYAN|nr:hypothetical protein [Trichocoleus sp. FACHB-46]MBD1861320.1 hypothetical protein [Trichocoleus sp. FACHB-46]